jgi:hypothetical protein
MIEEALRWEDRMAREREVSMKTMAATVVNLLRRVAAPRVPKIVWLAPLPKALPIWAPFPVCSRTMRIRRKHMIKWTMDNARYILHSS